MVRYRVKPGREAENEKYIQAVFAELAEKAPPGLRYASFKQPDGVSFVHIAFVEAAENPLVALEAFKEFTKTIKDRCEEPPVSTDLQVVGNYGLCSQ